MGFGDVLVGLFFAGLPLIFIGWLIRSMLRSGTKDPASILFLMARTALGTAVCWFLAFRLFGATAQGIVSYPMLLERYGVAAVTVVHDTAPFPATPLFTSAAGQYLGNEFVARGVRFGEEGQALQQLCLVAHPTATCFPGELATPMTRLLAAAARDDESIPVEYRLRFEGGITGRAYTAIVRVTFQRLR